MQTCKDCKNIKEDKEFNVFHGKLTKSCTKCRKYHNDYYQTIKDDKNVKAKRYYHSHKLKYKEMRFKSNIKRKYSLSPEEYSTMLQQQNNKCSICDRDFTDDLKPCVDHDHNTGKIRGLLCRRCNLNLQVVEDKNFVNNANNYLNKIVK